MLDKRSFASNPGPFRSELHSACLRPWISGLVVHDKLSRPWPRPGFSPLGMVQFLSRQGGQGRQGGPTRLRDAGCSMLDAGSWV